MPKRLVVNRTIDVIMLESDRYLGEKYEVVKVKPIYAKNILLPKGMAVLATANNLNAYKQKMEAAEAQRTKQASWFEDMISKIIDDGGLVFEKKANEKGSLYSKLDANEISDMIFEKYSIKAPSHLFKMKKKIGAAGDFKVLFVYKQLEKEVPLTVKAIREKNASGRVSMNKKAPIIEVTEEVVAEVQSEEKAKDSE